MGDQEREDRARAASLAAISAGGTTAPQSGFALFQAFMASTPVIASTLTAASVITAIGWLDMAKRAGEDDSYLAKSSVEAKVRPARTAYNPRLLEGLPGASSSGPNALEMFRRRNRDGVREDVRRVEQERAIDEAYTETPEESAALAPAASAETPEAAALRAMNPFSGDEKASEPPKKAKNKKMLAKALSRPKISGGGGLAGGIGGGFDLKIDHSPPASQSGQVRAMSRDRTKNITRGKTGVPAGRGGSTLRGATGKKLSSMNRAMSAAKGSGSATTASTHNSQWDASGNIGGSLSGSGASGNAIEGGGQVYDEGGLNEGGPLNAGGANAAAAPGEEEAPSVGKGKNATPNQKMIDMAMVLLPIASLLLLGAFLTGQNPAMKGAAKMLAYAALAVSAVVAGMGVMILSKGQAMQGGLLAAVGGALAVISYTAAEGNAAAAKGDEIAQQEAIQWAGPDGPTGPAVG